ncbi:MAG: fibronectin type III domain-containing protein [Croceitalea sp.]|nr:fibronectin type III domain-containing protein [Croceitalea sp.]
MKKYYLKLLLVFLILGCSKNDTVTKIEEEGEGEVVEVEEEVVNLAPNEFEIEIIDVSHESATISWNQAVDPENDAVTYDLYLNQNLIVESVSELTHQFIDLTELSDYTGQIIAKDTNGNETSKTFSFTTIKYYLKYLKAYDYGETDYGIGYASGRPYKMIKTFDKNYLIIGASIRPNGNAYQFFVLKIDYEGNELWKKFYDYNLYDLINPSVTEYSNGFIVTGANHIINIDNEGNLIWYKNIDDFGLSSNTININSVKNDSNNDFYLAGLKGPSEPGGGNEAVLLKIDVLGNIIWDKYYSVSLLDSFEEIYINSQNELIILGSIENSGMTWEEFVNGSSSGPQVDFWVVKLSNDGEIIWQNTYGDGRYDFPENIFLRNNGNFIISGYGWGVRDVSNGRIFEIDPFGNEVWNTTTELSYMYSIAETRDNNLIATGYVVIDRYGALGLYKYDSQGVEQWNRKLKDTYTYLYGHEVLPEEDGGYRIAASRSKNYYYDDEKPEILIYKTDPEGNYE